MKLLTDEKVIEKTEKILIGIQLICENVDDVVDSKLTSKNLKYKLKNFGIQSHKFEKMFWENLDNSEAELEFQNKVLAVEKVLNSIYK